ncbi:prenyltransferase [Mahella sp.]|uniref:prenyltransferase n=1 Tax=Mahella sp. TaxID=2798721 RepID=UPI0025B97227|nr:prenyltransferase [Mahella sp.]MBZ4666289.1 UbiA prenyltransferase [Mahella sp.]MDK2903272.1 1,4-dihydroxy-2-naphthoate polyprenyltransferase [Clostridiales bacterium]
MDKDLSRLWKGFWQTADPKIWVASTIPMITAAILAYVFERTFNIYWFILTLIGIYLIEIGKNAIGEFADYESGVDLYVAPDKRTPFSGGKKTIVDGVLTVNENKAIAAATFATAAIIGLYISFAREPMILWIGLAGFALAIMYNMPPFKLCYRGLGEITVGTAFGPLVMAGTYMVQTHTYRIEVLLASITLGLLIANVLWINQYPDYEADAQGGKRNWLVRMGKQKGLRVYKALFIASYIPIIALIFVTSNPVWLICFITVPLVYRALKVAGRYYDDIPRLMEANAKTVQIYQLTGLTLVISSITMLWL